MAVRAGRIAGAAHFGDLLALRHLLPDADQQLAAMAVQGLVAVAVVDDDAIAVAAVPARQGDGAAVGGHDGAAERAGQIKPAVQRGAAAGAEGVDKIALGRFGRQRFGADFLNLRRGLGDDVVGKDFAALLLPVDVHDVGRNARRAVDALLDDAALVGVQLVGLLRHRFIGDGFGVLDFARLLDGQNGYGGRNFQCVAGVNAADIEVGVERLYLGGHQRKTLRNGADGVAVLHGVGDDLLRVAAQKRLDFFNGTDGGVGDGALFNAHVLHKLGLDVVRSAGAVFQKALAQQIERRAAAGRTHQFAVDEQGVLRGNAVDRRQQKVARGVGVEHIVAVDVAEGVGNLGTQVIGSAEIFGGRRFNFVNERFHFLFGFDKAQALAIQRHFKADAEIAP